MATLPTLFATLAIGFCTTAFAWGPEGHRTIGALADGLIAGTRAELQVKSLLGSLGLREAAVWADCAKGVDPAQSFAYTARGRYPECAVFETAAREAEMSDFVRRNDSNCHRRSSEETCHKEYHYTDVAIQRDRYALGLAGTRADDIVAALAAAIKALRGEPVPAPFDIDGKREALLLLAHYVGDIHQPLHVGAIYLDGDGGRIDPDSARLDPATETRGGNPIITIDASTMKKGANLHALWDAVPLALTAAHVDPAWLRQARAVAPMRGDAADWPAAWASETLGQSRKAFAGLNFGPRQAGLWTVELPPSYAISMTAIKKTQLTEAGARLAQLLRTLWP